MKILFPILNSFWYQNIKFGEETYWDEVTIFERLQTAKLCAKEKGVRIVGEFGICRDIKKAPEYLKAVISSCKKLEKEAQSS